MNIVRLLSSVTTKYKNLYFLKKKKSTKIYKKLIFLSFSRFLTGLLLLFCSLSMTCQASHCSLTQHFPSVSVQVARGKLLPIHTVSLLRIKIRDVIIISFFQFFHGLHFARLCSIHLESGDDIFAIHKPCLFFFFIIKMYYEL